MADGDSVKKVTLLRKYDIPVEHLSYEYIAECDLKKKKELERIVRILRSGEEGIFPDLIKFAEKKLHELCPNSRVLRTEGPVLTKQSLETEEWKKVESEMMAWENDMKIIDKSLEQERELEKSLSMSKNIGLPEIRKITTKPIHQLESKNKEQQNKKNERIKSNDYNKWEKFDVDKELLKLDVEEERKEEELKKMKRELEKEEKMKSEKQKKEMSNIGAGDYSSMEKQLLANQAKDRGNECFKSGDYDNAVKYYSVSINFCPTATAFNNRAMALLKKNQFTEAVDDCNQVLKMEPNNVKALLRRGTAYQNYPGRNYKHLALADFEKILILEPNHKGNQKNVADLRKLLNVEPCDKKFRMNVEDSVYNRGPLPLTFYGPSTSRFVCMPDTLEHRVLSGAIRFGRLTCKCVDRSVRQNPLCQRCGERVSTPPPPRSRDVKHTNNMKNEELKQESENYKNVYNKTKDTGQGVYITELTEEECLQFEEDKKKKRENPPDNKVTELILENFDGMNLDTDGSSQDNKVETPASDNKLETAANDNKLENKRNKKKRKKKVRSELNVNESVQERKILQATKYIKPTCCEVKKEATAETPGGRSENEITSAFQFIKMWESCSKCDVDYAERSEILRSVKPSDLNNVIGNKLDGQMLSSVLECLNKRFATTPGLCIEYMRELSKLPRFGIIVMFLAESDKSVVRQIFERAELAEGILCNELKKLFLYS